MNRCPLLRQACTSRNRSSAVPTVGIGGQVIGILLVETAPQVFGDVEQHGEGQLLGDLASFP